MSDRAYGWKPSLPDPRDYVYAASGVIPALEVDPRGEMQAPYDQGQLGSCTANAVAGCVEYAGIVAGAAPVTPSRLDIYYQERLREGTVSYDSGAYGHDGFRAVLKNGWIPESDWPYNIDRFTAAPPTDSQHRLKIHSYHSVPRSIEKFKAVLTGNQTIALGFTVYESFESQQVADTGVMPYPDVHRERVLGGHEVLVVGYLKDDPNHALVRNSWGTGWGEGGYFRMPWTVILNSSMSSDFRTIIS